MVFLLRHRSVPALYCRCRHYRDGHTRHHLVADPPAVSHPALAARPARSLRRAELSMEKIVIPPPFFPTSRRAIAATTHTATAIATAHRHHPSPPPLQSRPQPAHQSS